MKFTTEELTEMRKLAGIEYSVVDYRRPQDFLAEAREPMRELVEDELPSNSNMPPKSVPMKVWKSKCQKIMLKSLLAKHKGGGEVTTGRKVPTEVKGENDSIDGGEVGTGRKPAIDK